MQDGGSGSTEYGVVAEALEALRRRLLDLTGRNKLLNFRHTVTGCLRIVDEIPDQLYERLMKNDSFVFDPVPRPTEAEIIQYIATTENISPEEASKRELQPPSPEKWARRLGMDVSYELPVEHTPDREPRHSDRRIQTLLYEHQLDARLKKLRGDARLAIEETGTNFLHLALGFIEWKESDQTEKSWLAPLVLVPVELNREQDRTGKFRYLVSWTGEDLQPNLSLQKKFIDDFGIAIPDLKDGERLEFHFQSIQKLLKDHPGWGVCRFATLALFQFGKILLYKDLDPDIWPANAGILDNELVRTLVLGSDDNGIGFENYEDPDSIDTDLRLELIDRADSSQAIAVGRALAGCNLVVQGPPGTGKSQTITNLIAAALARGKKVLFVSEKLAALEVVRKRLEEAELGDFVLELHSHKTRKLALIEDLKQRDQKKYPPPHNIEADRERLMQLRNQLENYVTAVRDTVGQLGMPNAEVLFEAGRQRLRKRERELPNLTLASLACESVTPSDRRRALEALEEFERVVRTTAQGESPSAHPWAGVSSERILGTSDEDKVVAAARAWKEALIELTETGQAALLSMGQSRLPGDDDLDNLKAILSAKSQIVSIRDSFESACLLAKRVTNCLGLSIADVATAVLITDNVAKLVEDVPSVIRPADRDLVEDEGIQTELEQALSELKFLQAATGRLDNDISFADAEALGAIRLKEIADILEHSGFFGRLGQKYRTAKTTYRSLARRARFDRRDASRALRDAASTIDRKTAFCGQPVVGRVCGGSFDCAAKRLGETNRLAVWVAAIRSEFGSRFSELAAVGKALYRLPQADLLDLQRILRENRTIRLTASRLKEAETPLRMDGSLGPDPICVALGSLVPKPLVEVIARAGDDVLTNIFAASELVVRCQVSEAESRRNFEEVTGLEPTLSHFFKGNLDDRVQTVGAAIAQSDRLSEWLELDRVVRKHRDSDIREIVEAIFYGQLGPEDGKLAFDFALFDGLARLAVAQHPILRQISAGAQDDWRSRYRDLDAQIMDLRAREIASKLASSDIPQGRHSPRVSELTEMNLIRREMSKKRAHIPIRRLVERAGGALQELKPCFMMGPLSVAQYLKPGSMQFDLLIFDEASQLKPEESIGAIARSRQLVVVGDSNQLPPTMFFDRIGTTDEDEEFVAVSPSILDVAEQQLPKAILRWHYRSQHPDLIRFSNERFYDGGMVLFPSPRRDSERLGVSFRFVDGAQYRSGRNECEAKAVAEEVVKHLRERPQESLGVAAMNADQRDLLDAKIDELLRDDIGLRERAESLSGHSEPFFVKNLENIQGDERDVIILSMTYGPDKDSGKVMQRFGPINSDDGWRRLNVLFSRAKRRMVVYSSMRDTDIVADATSKRGVRELKAFLRFAETGKIDGGWKATGAHPDSDFEIAVIEGLRRAGFDCEPQIGAMGFFVDIGVIDPDNSDVYVVGVECDGATYHSTRSARDRDRLRQEVLETMGWGIERVWSTDWFRDPERELSRLVNRINFRIADSRMRREQEAVRRGPYINAVVPLRIDRLQHRPLQFIEHEPSPRSAADTGTNSNEAVIHLSGPDDAADTNEAIDNTETKRYLSVEDARTELIRLRDEIAKDVPDAERTNGLLRRAMIKELLIKRPLDEDEFRRYVRQSLRQDTAPGQLSKYGPAIFSILERIRD